MMQRIPSRLGSTSPDALTARLGRRAWSAPERVVRRCSATIVAGLTALLLNEQQGRLGTACLVMALVSLSTRVVRTQEMTAAMAPLVRWLYPLGMPLLTLAALMFLKATSAVAGLSPVEILVICGTATVGSILSRAALPAVGGEMREMRIGVVGSARTAGDLKAELTAAGRVGFCVVGYLEPEAAAGARDPRVQRIGSLGEVADAVEKHRIDVLVISSEVPRLAFFQEIADACSNLPVRVVELTSVYEQIFGHVPVAAINAAWFQWVMHPRYYAGVSAGKRALDLAIATICAAAMAPVMLVLAILIRRDGGPVFYRQIRVGEGGRQFSMLKLRSMRVASSDGPAPWSRADDDRITGVGRIMRKTHLDELPQLLNVLRGEMTIVGPRPEQPGYVARLESVIPFYSRRHLIRPGITGWAQVNCGYGGSDAGSAWKLCHDLYYIKHRCMALDLLILVETVRTLFADRQFAQEVPTHSFVVATPRFERPTAEAAVDAAA